MKVEVPLVNSDHCTIKFKLITNNNYELDIVDNENELLNLDFTKANYCIINEQIEQINWEEVFKNKDINESWNLFLSHMKEIMQTNIPKRKNRTFKHANHWYNNTVEKFRKKKVEAWNRYKISGTASDYEEYKLALNRFTNEVKKAKLNFETKLAKDVKVNSKPFYKYIRDKSRIKETVGVLRGKNGLKMILCNNNKINCTKVHS